MTTYVKLVKGATKIKMAPPKQKYVEPILLGTTDHHDFLEIARALDERISDTAWTIVYKSLMLLHIMIREGEKNVALRHYGEHTSFFELNEISKCARWSSADIRALERYNHYLKVRCQEYAQIGVDFVRDSHPSLKPGNGRDVGVALDNVDSLEIQIAALIRNRYSQMDLQNDMLLFAFKLLVQDLLTLYNSLNEGIITLLESFFELSRSDAERTLDLYRTFVDLTEYVVKYLKAGKTVGLRIPVIKHITTKLIRSLEEHLAEDGNLHPAYTGANTAGNAPVVGTGIGATSPNSNANGDMSIAQKKLEQIREQKRLLEHQLKNQQILVSPSIPQQSYNPFGPTTDSFSFEAASPQISQATGNPFLQQTPTHSQTQPPQQTQFSYLQQQLQPQQQPQQQRQPTALSSSTTTPDLSSQQTGFYATHPQVAPSYTGAGFGGYSSPQQLHTNPFGFSQDASPAGSNPFSHEQQQHTAQLQAQHTAQLQAQHTAQLQAQHTAQQSGSFNPFGGSPFGAPLPQVPEMPQINQQQQQQQPSHIQHPMNTSSFAAPSSLPTVQQPQQSNYSPQQGFVSQHVTGYNPFQQQPQLQQPQQQHQRQQMQQWPQMAPQQQQQFDIYNHTSLIDI